MRSRETAAQAILRRIDEVTAMSDAGFGPKAIAEYLSATGTRVHPQTVAKYIRKTPSAERLLRMRSEQVEWLNEVVRTLESTRPPKRKGASGTQPVRASETENISRAKDPTPSSHPSGTDWAAMAEAREKNPPKTDLDRQLASLFDTPPPEGMRQLADKFKGSVRK